MVYSMDTCRIFVPCGALGLGRGANGISDEVFEDALALKPNIISCDAGSTDSGPYYLGSGNCKYSREAVKDDLRRILVGADRLNIPVTIGSCGTCGVDKGVDWCEEIAREICREEGLRPKKIAKIYTEQTADVLKQKYREGKIHPLGNAPKIDETTFDKCSHIVALSGAEPFIEALSAGADIVLCGRATDTAVIAAYPLMNGMPAGPTWHASKILECGSACVDRSAKSKTAGVVATINKDGFYLQAVGEGNRCSIYSVSAHMLYENSDPFRMYEPGLCFDVSESNYEQVEDNKVYVTNSKYTKMPYTMKLEGSGLLGYQTISMVGVRDYDVCRDPISWIDSLYERGQALLDRMGLDPASYSYKVKPYGYNAVSGVDVPEGYVPNEIGMLFQATASSQELATKIAKVFNPLLLHLRHPSANGELQPSFGFPFSPAEVPRGPLYGFMLNHVVEVDDPLELVRIEYVFTE